MNWKNVALVCATNRPMAPEARASIDRLRDLGVAYLEQRGFTDVALARNVSLTRAVGLIGQEYVLMVDDDIVFTPDQAEELLSAVHPANPCSGVYVMPDGYIAAIPTHRANRWLTGLGFFGVRRSQLADLARRSELCRLRPGDFIAFTWSGPGSHGGQLGQWLSEDFRLCARLGGVSLLPIGVGHVKSRVLMPDADTLEHVARGQVEARAAVKPMVVPQ